MDEQRTLRLDSTTLKALAHPLRSRLLAALRFDGPATATMLAQRLGTNSGATSYHLRQLADVGIVEEDPDAGRGRERVWRAAHQITSWTDRELLGDPDNAAAVEWLAGHHLRTTNRWVEDWVEARHEWPVEWRDASTSSDYRFRLTARELHELVAQLGDVLDRFRRPTGDEPEGAEDVLVVLHAFPARHPRL